MRYTALDGEVSQRRISQVAFSPNCQTWIISDFSSLPDSLLDSWRIILQYPDFSSLPDSGEILRHTVGQLRRGCGRHCQEFSFNFIFVILIFKHLEFVIFFIFNFNFWFLIFRNLNEAVILMEAPSKGRDWKGRLLGAPSSQKKSVSSAKEILSALTKEIHFCCKRNPFPSPEEESSLFSREIDFSQ